MSLAKCTSLRILGLSGCHLVSDISALSHCVLLHTLYLGCLLDLVDISPISNMKALNTLDLSNYGLYDFGCVQYHAVQFSDRLLQYNMWEV